MKQGCGGGGGGNGVSGVSRSVWEIHLPQTLNEEALADEFSVWEQVSSLTGAVRRSPHSHLRPRRIPVSLVFSFRGYVFIYGGALLLYRLVEKVFYPVCL